MITFSSDIGDDRHNKIFENLPSWKTHVLSIKKGDGDVPQVHSLKFLVAIKTRDEFVQWLEQYQDLSKATYSIRTTVSTSGKLITFKQMLVCQHNTQCDKLHDPTAARKTKNTNCPSSITVRIHAVYARYKGKDKEKGQLFKEMPCEIDMVVEHNHSMESAAFLKYRKPSSEVQAKLISLFNKGHSPATALDCIRTEIQLNCKDYPVVLADRNSCPDYHYCYALYSKIFKNRYGPMTFNEEGRKFLQKRLDEYNEEAGTVCAKMCLKEEDYVICICTPIMKRVHENIKAASRLVFMDSTGSLDHEGSRVFVLLTHSDCGGLPLGIIVTSSESSSVIETGFQLLKDIVGESIFGGNINGPNIFLTDDSQSEQNAVRSSFTNSKVLLCVFHVLQAVWRWLMKAKNGIPQQQQCEYFQSFKSIVYAQTKDEALKNYNIAKANISENHQNYVKYLEGYWQRRDQWAISYRIGLLIEGNHTNNISEAFMRIMKDKIFERVRAFNVIQLVDFIITRVNLYFQRRLLDSANSAGHKSFSRPIKVPTQEVLEKIKHVNGDILLVPSEEKVNHFYIVNMSVLVCTCFQGNMGKICKHIDWASTVFPSHTYREAINNTSKRSLYYYIATNEAPPEGWLEPLYSSQSEVNLNADNLVEMEVEDVNSVHTQEEEADTVADRTTFEEENNLLLREANEYLTQFTRKSPEEMNKGLKKWVEFMKKMMKNTSAFASFLINVDEVKSRKNRCKGRYIPVQATAVSRRRKNIIGRRSHPGGRPRPFMKQNERNMPIETTEASDVANALSQK